LMRMQIPPIVFIQKKRFMRLMLKVSLPIEPRNSMMKAGTFRPIMGRILAAIKAEAAYLTTVDGQRAGIIVVNVDDDDKVPSIAEPLFQAFKASVDISVAMTAEDLQAADDDIAQAAKIYSDTKPTL